MFCLVFERTGSIFPVIALHSINNSIAFAAQADGGDGLGVLGPLMLVACVRGAGAAATGARRWRRRRAPVA